MADEQMKPASDRGNGEPEDHVSAHDHRGRQLREAHDDDGPQRSCPSRRHADFCTDQCGNWRKPPGTIDRSWPDLPAERAIEIQQRKRDDRDSENEEDSLFVVFNAQPLQYLNPDDYTRDSSSAQQQQNSIVNLPPAQIDGQDGELDYRSEGEGSSHRNSRLEVKEENKNRRGNAAGTYTGQPDGTCDQKSRNIFQVGSAPN